MFEETYQMTPHTKLVAIVGKVVIFVIATYCVQKVVILMFEEPTKEFSSKASPMGYHTLWHKSNQIIYFRYYGLSCILYYKNYI